MAGTYHVMLTHVNQGRQNRYWTTTIDRHAPFAGIEERAGTIVELVIRGRAHYKMQLG